MSATRATRAKPLKTLDDLAELVQRNRGTVSRWLQHPDWTFGRPPWSPRNVPEILRWAAGRVSDRQGAGGPKTDERVAELRRQKLTEEVRKLQAQADQAETSLARERGELLSAAETEQQWALIGARVRNDMQNLPAQLTSLALAGGMPHDAAPQFQRQCEEAIARALQRLSDSEAPAEDDDDSTT